MNEISRAALADGRGARCVGAYGVLHRWRRSLRGVANRPERGPEGGPEPVEQERLTSLGWALEA